MMKTHSCVLLCGRSPKVSREHSLIPPPTEATLAWKFGVLLVSLYDPNIETTRMNESTFVMNLGRAKSLGDIQGILSRWEDTLNQRARTLDDDLKRSVLWENCQKPKNES